MKLPEGLKLKSHFQLENDLGLCKLRAPPPAYLQRACSVMSVILKKSNILVLNLVHLIETDSVSCDFFYKQVKCWFAFLGLYVGNSYGSDQKTHMHTNVMRLQGRHLELKVLLSGQLGSDWAANHLNVCGSNQDSSNWPQAA